MRTYLSCSCCLLCVARSHALTTLRVKNPAFLLHAVEVDSQRRAHRVYSKVGEVLGEGANVPVSDSC